MVSRRKLLIALSASAAVSWQGAFAAAPSEHTDGAAKFIDALAQQAINVLRDDSDSLKQREHNFRSLLSRGFDLPFIGRFVLGRHWRQATAQQRSDYLNLYSEFLLKTYSRRLSGFSGEKFAIAGARPAGKRDVMVRTLIKRPNAPVIKADWRVRVKDGQYKIIDVSVEGVSMAVTQRAEFAAVVRSHGMDGLLQALRMRTQVYIAKAS